MVALCGETFSINGVVFRKLLSDMTVAGQLFHSYQECYDYAYNINCTYSDYPTYSTKVVEKREKKNWKRRDY